MFKIIGKDGKEYGPVDVGEVRSWISQGRLDAQSLVKPEGAAEWRPLSSLPEFAATLAARKAGAPLPPDLPPQASSRVSGLAITSLVLSVLGPFTVGITAIPGLVIGIVALFKVHRSQGRLSGTGLAIGGLCLSGAVLMMVPVMAAMLLPALARAKGKAQSIQCMNNIKQLNLALIMYATDHRDQFPPADQWCDLIRPYTGGSTVMYHCVGQPGSGCSYAFNARLGNQKLSELGSPAQSVLIFSCDEGWNQSGGAAMAKAHSHAGGALSVGFADGHAEITRAERLRAMRWDSPPAELR